MIKFVVLFYCNFLEYNDCLVSGGYVCLIMNVFDFFLLIIYYWCSDIEIYIMIKKIFGICNVNR